MSSSPCFNVHGPIKYQYILASSDIFSAPNIFEIISGETKNIPMGQTMQFGFEELIRTIPLIQ